MITTDAARVGRPEVLSHRGIAALSSVKGMGEMPRKRSLDERPIYYCYALFDWLGIPRWIGKGKGNRLNTHEKGSSSNRMKDEFIEQTWIMLGEIPKLKIQENLTEAIALSTEIVLIKAIGRYPNGPLTNMDDGGGGISGYRHTKYTKRNFSERLKRRWESMTIDERKAATVRSFSSITTETLQENARKLNEWLTPDRRKQNVIKAKETYTTEKHKIAAAIALSGYTKDQLLARGQKSNSSISHDQRVENGRKAAATRIDRYGKRKWITDGIKSILVSFNQTVPDGWFLGRARKDGILTTRLPSMSRIWLGSGRYKPTRLVSYRGYYEDVALVFKVDEEPITIDAVRDYLRGSIGRIFEGYKGGSYRADRNTAVWITTHPSEAYGNAIVAVEPRPGGYELVVERIDP